MAKVETRPVTLEPVTRTTWNYDRALVSDLTGLRCEDPSLTIQSQKEEADINTIVRNFGVTGRLPESIRQPIYDDFTDVSDYRTALEAVKAAEASFSALPASLRAKLGHSPQRFLEYCADPSNIEEMKTLGLVLVPAPPETPPAG